MSNSIDYNCQISLHVRNIQFQMRLIVQGALAAERYDHFEVLLLKNVRVLKFEGEICLRVVYLKTAMIVNPDLPEVHALRQWAVIKWNEDVQ